jgi:hypothetical protein
MLLKIALIASVIVPVLHIAVLLLSGQNAITDPISELSRQSWAGLQTLGLVSFGIAHLALAAALGRLDHGRLWPYGRGLLAAGGITLFLIAYYFVAASADTLTGPTANDPLWIVATLIGLAMGALQPGLSRLSMLLGAFSAVCLGIWLWMIPLILLVNDSWLGAYERLVGIVYVIWMIGVSKGLMGLSPKAPVSS